MYAVIPPIKEVSKWELFQMLGSSNAQLASTELVPVVCDLLIPNKLRNVSKDDFHMCVFYYGPCLLISLYRH